MSKGDMAGDIFFTPYLNCLSAVAAVNMYFVNNTLWLYRLQPILAFNSCMVSLTKYRCFKDAKELK